MTVIDGAGVGGDVTDTHRRQTGVASGAAAAAAAAGDGQGCQCKVPVRRRSWLQRKRRRDNEGREGNSWRWWR